MKRKGEITGEVGFVGRNGGRRKIVILIPPIYFGGRNKNKITRYHLALILDILINDFNSYFDPSNHHHLHFKC